VRTRGCFTEGQIRSLEAVYGDLNVNGRLFPGWPVGGESSGANGRSGWDGWIIGTRPTTASCSHANVLPYRPI
jgi:hypothetical protein